MSLQVLPQSPVTPFSVCHSFNYTLSFMSVRGKEYYAQEIIAECSAQVVHFYA